MDVALNACLDRRGGRWCDGCWFGGDRLRHDVRSRSPSKLMIDVVEEEEAGNLGWNETGGSRVSEMGADIQAAIEFGKVGLSTTPHI